MILHAPSAVGDVLDRLSILAIKRERVSAGPRREHVLTEIAALEAAWAAAGLPAPASVPEYPELARVNLALWEVEDRLRAREAAGDFGPDFVAEARSVYRTNDERAALKRAVNLRFGSSIVEVKQHPAYGGS